MEKPRLNLRVTPLVLEDVVIEIEDRGGVFFYRMDGENFLKDSRNDLKILNLLLEQREIIEAYQRYYEKEK